MSQHKGGRAAILFILVGGLGVGSLAYYVKSTPRAAHVPEELRVENEGRSHVSLVPEVTQAPPARRTHLKTKPIETDTVRLPVFGDDVADMELSKAETQIPVGTDAMRFVANRIAQAAHFDGARVLGVDVRDHVAFVDYDAAVQKGMGSMEEGAFLRALQIGFGQFTDVDKVAVQSEGKPLESGHVDLTEPLSVVRPGEKPGEDPKPVEP